MGRFVKLYEKFTEWEWYHDANTVRLFLHLLIKANWKPSKYKGHDIDVGQIPTGHRALSIALGMSERSIRTAFKHLKSTGEVTVDVTNKFSIVTLVNYGKYNDAKPEDDGQNDRQRVNQASDKRQAARQSSVSPPTTLLELQTDQTEQTDHTDQIIFPAASVDAPGTPKASRPATTDIQRVWEAYREAIKERYGIDVEFEGGKTAAIIKRILKGRTLDDARQIVRTYVSLDDQFIVKESHPISLVSSKMNQILVAMKQGSGTSHNMENIRRLDGGEDCTLRPRPNYREHSNHG